MKRKLYRSISFIVAVCLILSAVPFFARISATENEIPNRPPLPLTSDVVISMEGTQSTFGTKFNNLPGNTKNTLASKVDLSFASAFEFDVYVESEKNLKTAINGYSGNKEQGLLFAFSSATVSALYLSQQTATVDITSQITQDGWNHITVSKADFVGTAIKWENVKYAFLKFADNANTAYSTTSQLAENGVAVANICSVWSCMEDAIVLDSDIYKNTLGNTNGDLVSSMANRFTKRDLESVNLQEDYYIFADFKVTDYEKFSTLLQGKQIQLVLYSNEKSATDTVDVSKVISVGSVWKRLKICVSEFTVEAGFDWSSVNGYSLGVFTNDTDVKLGEYHSLELVIGAVYSSIDNPEKLNIKNKYTTVGKYYDELTGGILTEKFDFELPYSNTAFDWTAAGLESYTYSTVHNDGENKYFDNVEFDLYVEDAAMFANALKSKSNTLVLSFYSNSKTDDKNTLSVTLSAEDVAKLVKYNGWNHIVIDAFNDLKKAADGCTFDFAKVTGWKLSFGGNAINDNTASYSLIQIANICTTVKKVPAPQIANKYKLVSTYYSEVSFGVLGKDFGFTLYHSNATPFDLTASGLDSYTYKTVHETDKENKYFDYIEFDIYVDDVDSLISACKEKSNTIKLQFNSNGSVGEKDSLYIELSLNEMARFLVNDGWNHVVVEAFISAFKGSSAEDFDFAKVTSWTLCFGGNTAIANSAEGQLIEIANICTTVNKVEKPAVNNKHKLVTEYYTDMITKTCNYDFSWQKIISHNDNPIDWTSSGVDNYTIKTVIQKDFVNKYFDTLEFDFYVADIDEFCNALSAKNNQVRLRFYTNAVAIGESNLLDIRFTGDDFRSLLTQDGWNHITIDTDKFTYKGTPDFTKVTSWLIDFVGNLSNYNGAKGQKIAIANLCITDDTSKPNKLVPPELPENVLTKIEEESAHALGAYFGYTSDRIYAEGIGPYDFSKGNSIEFDIYVSDYELLKKSFDECPRGENLYLVLSSVPLKLFSQYSKPRTYYSVQCSISDYITQSGWNHVKLGKNDFSKLLGNMDWSNITSFMLRYSDCKFNQTDPEEKNPAGDVRIKITNIVNTGIVSTVPFDTEKPAKPDKNAVYINDAENLVDDNGSWNPSEVYLDENYKSESTHSVLRKVSYETKPEYARMFYLFDYTAGMRDVKTVKFDFFVDISQFIQKSGNVLEFGLSSDRNFKSNYVWKIDASSLKDGWNSLSFDISNAQKNGKVSLNEIKTVFLRFGQINLNAEEYETVVIGIDNLRYLSNNGNTVLKINDGMDDEIDTDIELDDDFTDNSTDSENVIMQEAKTIYSEKTVNELVTNYTAALIILSVEFAVLSAASVIVFIILKKKKII